MDLNGDGNTDILSGSYLVRDQHEAGLFHVLYGKPSGGFQKAQVLNGADGQPLILPTDDTEDSDASLAKTCTRPFACDLDGDGKLDLVAGNFRGTFGFFKGIGEGRFSPQATWLQSGAKSMQVAMHSDPFLIDWDGDGDLDLLSGSASGGAFLFDNAGSKTSPKFGERQTLLKPSGSSSAFPTNPKWGNSHIRGPQSNTRVWSSDVDGDGKLDLLIGDQATIQYPADGLDEQTANEKLQAWNEKLQASMESAGEGRAILFGKAVDDLMKEREQFMTENMTGFVWLLRRK